MWSYKLHPMVKKSRGLKSSASAGTNERSHLPGFGGQFPSSWWVVPKEKFGVQQTSKTRNQPFAQTQKSGVKDLAPYQLSSCCASHAAMAHFTFIF